MSAMLNVREKGSRVLLHTEKLYSSTGQGEGGKRCCGCLEPTQSCHKQSVMVSHT